MPVVRPAVGIPDKRALLDLAIATLSEELQSLRASAAETRKGAVHEESRAENDKDTRGLEASYLARGQAQRVEQTEEAIHRLRFLSLRGFEGGAPIGLSALITLEVEGEEQRYLLVPAGGGIRLRVGGAEVRLITPASPLGRALLEKVEGEAFELRLAGRTRECEVLEVR